MKALFGMNEWIIKDIDFNLAFSWSQTGFNFHIVYMGHIIWPS